MKKYSMIAILIAIILLAGGFMIYNNYKQPHVKVGDIDFVIPEGYNKSGFNNLGHITLKNENNSIYLASYNTTNISEYINQYKNNLLDNNESIIITNFSVDNISVYKSINNQTKAEHYWFVKNGKMYTIYNWEYNPNMDKIFEELLKSSFNQNF